MKNATTETTILKEGMRLYSTDLDCYHIITKVTDKRISYTPEIQRGGLKVNKNTIRIFSTSIRIANEWLKTNWKIVE